MDGPFDIHALVLVPLTPIHVGGGEEARLLPEDYRLRNGWVERLSTRAILARLPAVERAQWLHGMQQAQPGAMQRALSSLHDKATGAEILERIPISPESARATDLRGEGQGRRNQIDAFFRAGGRPCLPGSSVKGALRTAWAAEMARRFGAPRLPGMGERQTLPTDQRAERAEDVMDQLFALAGGKRAQDTDPFRDVTVADAPLPEGATRIDPVRTWKRGAGSDYGFESRGEMHRERPRSVADGGAPPVIHLTVGLRRGALREEAARLGVEKRPRADRIPDSLAALLTALEAHHAPLWQREVDVKFFAGPVGDRLRQARDVFRAFTRDGAAPEAALIRLGWAAHAEAKSLPGLRRIVRPQERGEGRIAPEGSARHVVNLDGHPLPFGWALLIRAEAWAAKAPRAWLAPPAPRAPPAPSGRGAPVDPRAGTALGQQRRYRRGERVRVDGEAATLLEDVTQAMRDSDEVTVDFGDGPEPVKISSIEGSA